MTPQFGHFPFGRPNSERPMRTAQGAAQAIVIGVYPSAWHVTWTAPNFLTSRGAPGRRGKVNALAVDVEPTVFWSGAVEDFERDLARWMQQTSFVVGDGPGSHGHISRNPPPQNGSSGKTVETRYLTPLGIGPAQTAFTDIYPAFLVKYGIGKRREQGDAIGSEFDSIAEDLGRPAASIGRRPRPADLPRMAVEVFADRIVGDLEQAAAPLVITLGEEAFAAMLRLPQLAARAPRTASGDTSRSLIDLYGNGYGARGVLQVNGQPTPWLPLAHPGLLKGEADPTLELDAGRRSGRGWNTMHGQWEQRSLDGA